ncbi:MAG: extracellular solute-binding protein [Cellulosilyticaceae bacterium]
MVNQGIKRWFSKGLLICLVLFCIGGIISIEGKRSGVVIYSAMESFRNEKLEDMLREKFPEIDITIQYTSANKGAAKLRLEESYTDADIVIGFDIQSLELVKDIFADLGNYSDDHYIDGLNPKHNKYKIWEKFAGAIIVNVDILDKMDLPMPTSYEDLLNPIYKDLIVMPDPKSSGTGYFFLKNRVNVIGEEEGIKYFEQLYQNIKQFMQSGSGPIKLLLQEEAAIALGMTFQAVSEINKGANLKIIYPPEGSPYSLTGISIIAGREQDKDVQSVFEFLYENFIFYDKEYYSPELIFKDQDINIKNYPTDIIYGNMEGIGSAEEKQRLLKRWKY